MTPFLLDQLLPYRVNAQMTRLQARWVLVGLCQLARQYQLMGDAQTCQDVHELRELLQHDVEAQTGPLFEPPEGKV